MQTKDDWRAMIAVEQPKPTPKTSAAGPAAPPADSLEREADTLLAEASWQKAVEGKLELWRVLKKPQKGRADIVASMKKESDASKWQQKAQLVVGEQGAGEAMAVMKMATAEVAVGALPESCLKDRKQALLDLNLSGKLLDYLMKHPSGKYGVAPESVLVEYLQKKAVKATQPPSEVEDDPTGPTEKPTEKRAAIPEKLTQAQNDPTSCPAPATNNFLGGTMPPMLGEFIDQTEQATLLENLGTLPIPGQPRTWAREWLV